MTNPLSTADLPIIFKDNECLVVDKPAGISVHNAEESGDLLNLLARRFGGAKYFPVHRLDKETSGVQLFALTAAAAQALAARFQERDVRKLYVGITRGALAEATGVWSTAISDRSESRKNPQGVSADRVRATTGFKVLASSKYFSKVEFDLETGRQHQIRKHCALARHALVGDARYGDPKYNARMAELYGTPRMFLHHVRLEIAGKVFESPLPTEFTKLGL